MFAKTLDDFAAIAALLRDRDAMVLSDEIYSRIYYGGEPPADRDALYSGLAGQILCNRMRALEIALQNRGVKLTVTDADRIKTQVASGYLDVKRRQAL